MIFTFVNDTLIESSSGYTLELNVYEGPKYKFEISNGKVITFIQAMNYNPY